MDSEPLNPNVDPTQMILASQRGAVASAIGSLDADPEAAARSMELSGVTGVPAPVINSNLEGFEQQHKAQLTAQLLNSNEYLQRFINSNPMAAKVANDDYANLDAVSQAVSSMSLPQRIHRALTLSDTAFPGDPLQRFKEGGPLGSWLSSEDIQNHPFASAVVAGLGAPIELLLRGLGGALETTSDAAKNLATAAGGESLGRDVGAMTEAELMGLSGNHPMHSPEIAAYEKARPYLENGREPPQTALPEYDDFRTDQNKQDVEALDDATKAAQSSALRERSPNLFADFINQHTDAEIGVSGEMVAKLYGDKLPEADDGLLGWVPGIQDKLALARDTGADVNIPLSDWLANVEPEVAKALHDDIRVRPNGITANEANIAKEQLAANPTESLAGEVPQTRAASALEPLFSVGDRKLELQRLKGTEGAMFGPEHGFHDFSINDEKGNPVGTINLSQQAGGKDLYVEMINGINGLGPRDFGPSLMRSLKAQLKQEFPEAERIGGHRVGGMREKFGTYDKPSAQVWVKLDATDTKSMQDFGQVLEGGKWEQYSRNINAYIKPYAERSVEDRNLVDAVADELDRIVPNKLRIELPDTIRATAVEGQGADEIKPHGAYIAYKDAYPLILAALDSDNVLGTARHEAIHHLRNYGFFKPEEWSILEKAVSDNRWADQFRIEERYPNLSPELRREEAIADAYKEWAGNRDFEVSPEVHGLFERMKQFFAALKERIGAILGKDPTWEDIFKKVDAGEVGGREGTQPLDPRAFNEQLAVDNNPQKYFHGSPTTGIDKFIGDQVYLTKSRKVAENYATQPIMGAQRDRGGVKSPTVYNVDVNVQKTFDFTNPEHQELYKQIREEYNAKQTDPDMLLPKLESGGFINGKSGHISFGYASEVLRQAEKLGFDSIYVQEAAEHGIALLAKVDKLNITKSEVPSEKLSVEPSEGGSRVFERAAALGMTVDQFRRYDELMQQRHAEDVAAATKRAESEVAREHTKQWKEDRKALRTEVSEDIKQRPDVAADLFFGAQELYGKKLNEKVKLNASDLTPEQKATLPRDYYGADGVHPDDVANLFGYGSGDVLVERLGQYNAAKLAANMSAKDFVSRVTDIETDRQMRIRHGDLGDNIIDAVKEQVTGQTQQDILHEETVALGMKAGQAPLDKATIVQQLKDNFAKMPLGSVSSDAYMRAAGKAGRQAELSLLENDPANAFKAKQQQYYATVIANEASKLEKETNKFLNKIAKPYSRVFDPRSSKVDPEYSLMVRNMLSKIELPYGMSVQGMEKALSEASSTNLADFVKQVNKDYSLSGVSLPVVDFLQDDKFNKPFKDLTVDEFRGIRDSIVATDRFGRDVHKVEVAGAKQDKKDWVKAAGNQLSTKFEPKDFGATGKPGAIRTYMASMMNTETLFGRFDGRDPNGLFTKMFVYPGMAAADYKDVLIKEYSAGLKEAGPIKDAPKKLVSPLIDPRTNKPVTDFTRENLATIISNMGNEYNWRVFTKGWKIDPDVLMKWVEANSTVEDLDRAQAIGKLFDKGKAHSDTVYQQLYGVAPENIQVRPFVMHGKQYEGWYHPIIRDPLRSKVDLLNTPDPAEGSRGSYWPSVSNPYNKRRTGAIDVVSLSQDMIPIKLNQMLHFIAFQDFVHNTAKITRDPTFRKDISTYYGPHYMGTIDTWLERIAGNASYRSDAMAMATRLSNQMRGNVISTYIAFSPTTIEKHSTTAGMMSAREIGAKKFIRAIAEVGADSYRHAVMDLFGRGDELGDSIWQFVKKNSELIQSRDRNFENTLGGQMDLTLQKSTLRQRIIELGSKGVAFSDLLSAIPTWWAKYQDVLAETGDVEQSTYQANRAVRRAHGSTSIVNQPTIVSNTNPLSPWLTSIYGFFGTNMQRRFEIAHDLNDMYKLARGGEISQAAAMAPEVMANIFTYVVWPGLVEEAVSSQFFDDKKKGGLVGHALAFTLGTAASTFIGIRDLAYGLTHDHDPQAGLISSPLHDVSQLIRDAKKDHPLSKQNAGKLVEDAITVFGDATGKGPKHIGAAARYGIDVLTHQQKPKSFGHIYRGLITGNQEKVKVQ